MEDAEAENVLPDTDGIDLIVLDATASDTPGINVALQAKERGIRLVMISGNPKEMEAFHARADQLLWKPFMREEWERAVQAALASAIFGQRVEDPA